jgi:hypothetical protein
MSRFSCFLPDHHIAALRESPPDTPSKNRCTTVRYGMHEEWLPTHGGRSLHCDLPRRLPRLAASFDTRLSRSTLASSSSAHTSHPFVQFQDRRLCIVGIRRDQRFAEALAAVRPCFIQEITEVRDTPKVRSSPRKLLRSSEALRIAARRSSA